MSQEESGKVPPYKLVDKLRTLIDELDKALNEQQKAKAEEEKPKRLQEVLHGAWERSKQLFHKGIAKEEARAALDWFEGILPPEKVNAGCFIEWNLCLAEIRQRLQKEKEV